MPQVTVYIRKEDLPLWTGVNKKSEFMHDALNNMAVASVQYSDSPSEPAKERFSELSSRIQEAEEAGKKEFIFCKHDQIKGLCKKGCR